MLGEAVDDNDIVCWWLQLLWCRVEVEVEIEYEYLSLINFHI